MEVCRLCLGLDLQIGYTFSPLEGTYKDMVQVLLPELNLKLTKDPVICGTCLDNLQKLHHFKMTCLKIESKLTDFCESHEITSSNQISLHSVLELDLSDMDTDTVKSEVFGDESVRTPMKSAKDSEIVDPGLKQEEIYIKSELGTDPETELGISDRAIRNLHGVLDFDLSKMDTDSEMAKVKSEVFEGESLGTTMNYASGLEIIGDAEINHEEMDGKSVGAQSEPGTSHEVTNTISKTQLGTKNPKKKPRKKCFVKGCENNSKSNPNKVFVSLPKDEKLREQWYTVAQKKPMSLEGDYYCCDDHFVIIPKDSKKSKKENALMCKECRKIFTRTDSLKRHVSSVHATPATFPCDLCVETFTRQDDISIHMKYNHGVEYQPSSKRRKITPTLDNNSDASSNEKDDVLSQSSVQDMPHACSYIPLPKEISNTGAVVNVQNPDNKCFAYAILSAFHPGFHHVDRVSHYKPYLHELNFEGITFPVRIRDVPIFEQQNENISINVFALKKSDGEGAEKYKVVGPLHHAQERKKNHVNLLYLEEGGSGHFCWIKNLSRLVTSQLSAPDHKKYICDGCLVFFNREKQLVEHDCSKLRALLPAEGKELNVRPPKRKTKN